MDPHWRYTISRITQKNCSNKHVSHPKGEMARPNPILPTSGLLTPGRKFTAKKRKHKSLSPLLKWGQILGLASNTCPSKTFTNARGSLQLTSDQPNSSLITYHNLHKLDKNVHFLTLRVGGCGELLYFISYKSTWIAKEEGFWLLVWKWVQILTFCVGNRTHDKVLCPLKPGNRVGVFMRHATHPRENSPWKPTQGNYWTQKRHWLESSWHTFD